MAPVPGDSWNRADCPDRRACAAVALEPESDSDRGRSRGGEPLAQPLDDRLVEPADLGGPLGGPLPESRLELGPADRVPLEPVAVLGAGVEHSPHEPERERGVRPRQKRDVLVAALGRVRAERIDDNHVRARFLRLEHEAPLMDVRREKIRAPEDDEPSAAEVFRIEADGPAERGAKRSLGGGSADRQPEAGGPESAEEPLAHRRALDEAHRAREVVGEDGLRAVPLDRAAQPGGDEVERLAPGDSLEAALAFGADAPEGVEEPLRGVEPVEVVVDLAAERAPRERVVARAAERNRAPVLDCDVPGAGVRAVERARSANHRRHGVTIALRVGSSSEASMRFCILALALTLPEPARPS